MAQRLAVNVYGKAVEGFALTGSPKPNELQAIAAVLKKDMSFGMVCDIPEPEFDELLDLQTLILDKLPFSGCLNPRSYM